METPSFEDVLQSLLEALPQPRRIIRLHFQQLFGCRERRGVPATLATFQVQCTRGGGGGVGWWVSPVGSDFLIICWRQTLLEWVCREFRSHEPCHSNHK